jgi:hypothetical protein
MRFEFCEELLDRVQVRTIGRQQPQLCACRLYCLAHSGDLVGGEIIHRHDLARREGGHQTLFEIGEEDFAVHRGIDDEWGSHASQPQAGDESGHLPVAVRYLGDEPFAARAVSVQPGHVVRRASLLDEDKPARIKPRLLLLPLRARRANVFAVLFGRVQAFF